MFYSQLSGSDLLLLREKILYFNYINVDIGSEEETTEWENLLMNEIERELSSYCLDTWINKNSK